jgi:formylglycine-generating enzyme required for sulfatase activity
MLERPIPAYELKSWQLLRLLGLMVILLCNLTAAAQAESIDFLPKKHLALVIGISSYTAWSALPKAAGDAREVAGLLEFGGFNTKLVVNPDSQTLQAAWKGFVQAAADQPDSACVVYYRGHAETLIGEHGRKSGWIVPTDAPLTRQSQEAFERLAIRVDDWMEDAAAMPARHLMFLFDTSFADDRIAVETPALRLLSPTSGLAVRQTIIAGNAFEPVPDQSRFKDYLFKALSGEADTIDDGYVTGSELAVYLTNHVTKATGGQQNPQYALSKDKAFARGDFAFKVIAAKRTDGRLYVDTQPAGARVRVLNIRPKFVQGMPLDPGSYQLEVSAAGHRACTKWVSLAAGEDKSIQIRLTKIEMKFSNTLGMTFRFIPAGTFQMGSPSSSTIAEPDEVSHPVTLTRPFYMQTGEVAVWQFRRFVEATGYQSETFRLGGCWISSDGHRWHKAADMDWKVAAGSWPQKGAAADDLPVSCVTWNDAEAFARWLSQLDGRTYQLPTEAQWEYACRANSSSAFAFGECLPSDLANYGGIGPMASYCQGVFKQRRNQLVPDSNFGNNAWGLYHMHGNVAEWCDDYYGPYLAGAIKDPTGPRSGTEKVIRGGHYLSLMTDCRSARRSSFPPPYASSAVGFRLTARAEE